jgi:hypothetical protein
MKLINTAINTVKLLLWWLQPQCVWHIYIMFPGGWSQGVWRVCRYFPWHWQFTLVSVSTAQTGARWCSIQVGITVTHYTTKFDLALQSRPPKWSTVIIHKVVLFEEMPSPYFTFSLGTVHKDCVTTTVWIW